MLFVKQLVVITFMIAMLPDIMFNIKEAMYFFAVFISLLLIEEKHSKRLIND